MDETQEVAIDSQSQTKRKRKEQAEVATNSNIKRAKPRADTYPSVGLDIMEYMGPSDVAVPEVESPTANTRSSLPRFLNSELVEDSIELVSDPVVGFGNGDARQEQQAVGRLNSLFGDAAFSDTSDDEQIEHKENAAAPDQGDEAMLTLIDMRGIDTSELED